MTQIRKGPNRVVISFVALIILSFGGFHLIVQAAWGPLFLSDVALLLPASPTKEKLNHKLIANSGCFRWSSTKPAAATVVALFEVEGDETCSRSAIVSAVSPVGVRATTLVLAQELSTGRMLRCEVFVDDIASIEITHTSTNIYVNERETLGILAYDSNVPRNLFSTISGLQFKWSVSTPDGGPAGGILRLIPGSRKESSEGGDEDTKKSVSANTISEHIIVEGVNTGRAQVTARLLVDRTESDKVTSTSTSVSAAKVVLSVFEPLLLVPHEEQFVVPGSLIQYELQSRRGADPAIVPLPDIRFEFSTTDATIVKVEAVGKALSSDLGITEVRVTDTQMPENVVSAVLHVVNPNAISLVISPISNNGEEESGHLIGGDVAHMVSGREYLLQFSVVDNGGNPIRHTGNIQYQVAMESEKEDRLKFVQISQDSEKIRVKALEMGEVVVVSKLPHILKYSGFSFDDLDSEHVPLSRPLILRTRVIVSPPVTVAPSSVLLPFDDSALHVFGTTPLTSAHMLRASGGVTAWYSRIGRTEADSDAFVWTSSIPSAIAVSASGALTASSVGSSEITVASRQDRSNYASASVTAHLVQSLSFIPGPVEVTVGDYMILQLGAKDTYGKSFAPQSCMGLDIQWHVDDASAFEIIGDDRIQSVVNGPLANMNLSESSACAWTILKGSRPAHTLVRARWGTLEASVTVASYQPLHLFPPVQVSSPMELAVKSEKKEEEDTDTETLSRSTISGMTGDINFARRGVKSSEEPLVVVSPGSSVIMTLEGGPAPWIFDPSGSGADLKAKRDIEENVLIEHLESGRYRVTCNSVGEFELHGSVFNQPSTRNPYPARAFATCRLACRHPQALILRPVSTVPHASLEKSSSGYEFALLVDREGEPSCVLPDAAASTTTGRSGGEAQSSTYMVRNGRLLLLQALIVDHEGHVFCNSSSVPLVWGSSREDLAAFPSRSQLLSSGARTVVAVGNEGISADLRWAVEDKLGKLGACSRGNEAHIAVGRARGSVKISANLTVSSSVVGNTVSLRLVNPVELFPKRLSLYLSPFHAARFDAIGGSGSYAFTVNNSEVATSKSSGEQNTEFGQGRNHVFVEPIRSGNVEIRARDRCFSRSGPSEEVKSSPGATAEILVSGISSLELRGRQRVELGHDLILEVEALDSAGKPFGADQMTVMGVVVFVRLGSDSDVTFNEAGGYSSMISAFSGRAEKTGNEDRSTLNSVLGLDAGHGLEIQKTGHHATVIVRGLRVGSGVLVASACISRGVNVTEFGRAKRYPPSGCVLIKSQPLQITVHSPLRLSPRSVVMVPSSQYQVSVSGGPHSGVQLIYEVIDPSVATVDTSGVVTGRSRGATTLRVSALGHDKLSGEQVEYGSDTIPISVTYLEGGVSVFSKPFSRILIGTEVQLRLEGLNGENSFALSSAGIEVEWTVSDSSIVELVSRNADCEEDDEECLAAVPLTTGMTTSIVAHGLRAGVTSVTARLAKAPSSLGKSVIGLVDAVTLEVSEPLLVSNLGIMDGNGVPTLRIPPQSSVPIQCNQDRLQKLTYSLLSWHDSDDSSSPRTTEDIVDVDQSGLVVAGKRSGTALVSVSWDISQTTFEDGSEANKGQTLSHGIEGLSTAQSRDKVEGSHITLKHPSHMAIVRMVVSKVDHLTVTARCSSNQKEGQTCDAEVPVGGTAVIYVTPRDTLGLPFSSHDSLVFHVESNLRDIVSPIRSEVLATANAATTKVHVRALRRGSATVRISLRDSPHVFGYVLLQVSSAINPALPVMHIGSNVTFHTSVPDGDNNGHVWASEKPEILSIHRLSGVAKAGQVEGITRVYRLPSHSDGDVSGAGSEAMTVVRTVKVDSIRTDSALPFITNVPDRTGKRKNYMIPLTFWSADNSDVMDAGEFMKGESVPEMWGSVRLDSSLGVNQNIVAKCVVSDQDWAHAHLIWKKNENNVDVPHCSISPLPPPTSIPPSTITVELLASDYSGQYTTKQTVGIPFKPSFTIINQNAGKWLGGRTVSAIIRVKDSPMAELEAIANDDRYISIQQLSEDAMKKGKGGEVEGDRALSFFEILVLGNVDDFSRILPFNTSATIRNYVTGQEESIEISYTPTARVELQKAKSRAESEADKRQQNVEIEKSKGEQIPIKSEGINVRLRTIVLAVFSLFALVSLCYIIGRINSWAGRPNPVSSPLPRGHNARYSTPQPMHRSNVITTPMRSQPPSSDFLNRSSIQNTGVSTMHTPHASPAGISRSQLGNRGKRSTLGMMY